jgi:biotin operon repressor
MTMSRFPRLLVIASASVLGAACSTDTPRTGEANDAGANPPAATAPAREVDWKAVDQAMGRTGAIQPGDVHRYAMPRSDLAVTVQGVRIRPALALGSWIAFKATSDGAMAMGDLVLGESEVAPVMSRLQEAGIEQTAVHHHVLHETPRVLYMHVHGHGDPVKIAEGVRAAIDLTSTPPQAPTAPAPAGELGIDTTQIAAILGHSGRVNGGVYQVSVPRAEPIRDGSMEIPPSMGVATAINFQPTGGGKAAITGDFVMIASEVNPVIRALRQNGIEVTSLHNHLLTEEPRLFFMHFWANDDAVKLARGLRAALDATSSQRGPR